MSYKKQQPGLCCCPPTPTLCRLALKLPFDRSTRSLTRWHHPPPNANVVMSFRIQPGHTYKLIDTKSRVVLHLSMADFKSIAGVPWDASDNQKVRFPRFPR